MLDFLFIHSSWRTICSYFSTKINLLTDHSMGSYWMLIVFPKCWTFGVDHSFALSLNLFLPVVQILEEIVDIFHDQQKNYKITDHPESDIKLYI